jgi:lysophospholipase L1-like esterase
MKGRNSLLTNLGIALLSIILCLFALEMTLRTRHTFNNFKIRIRDKCTRPSADPRLIYEFTPGKCANKNGFLDHDYGTKKGDGVFRIVIIGDSIAQGEYVKPEESFGKVLERKLNSAGTDRKFEVIIMAVSGYSTSQELVLLEEKALKVDPDIIIWSYCLNDPAHPIYHNANGEYGRYFYKPDFYIKFFIERRMFLLKEKKMGRRCGSEFHELLHCVYWDQIESNISQIGSLTKQKNIPVLFLIHPVFEKDRDFGHYSLTAVHSKLREAALKAGLIPLDLLDAYKPYQPDELRVHNGEQYDPWHPNAKGHLIAAESIYDKLRTDNIAGAFDSNKCLMTSPDRRIEKEDDLGEPFRKIEAAGHAVSALTFSQ